MNQTIKIFRNGIFYGAAVFILGLIIGTYYHYPQQETLLASGVTGIAALLANGLIHRKYTKPVKVLQAITFTPSNAEVVKIQTPANHTIDEHLVPGKLFLTDKRLVFISCEQEERAREEFSWPLTSQQSFKFYPTIFNVGGEFIIDYKGQQLVFEVDELNTWKKALSEK